jgi:hypothetical protein
VRGRLEGAAYAGGARGRLRDPRCLLRHRRRCDGAVRGRASGDGGGPRPSSRLDGLAQCRLHRPGRRSWSLEDHQPGRAWIERAMRETRAAAIKFSPGVDRRAFGAIPIAWEFIEDHGTLVQAVAWTGAFARQTAWTRATRIGASIDTIAGVPDDARADRIAIADGIVPGRFLCEPCAALERAQLLTEAAGGAARELARGLGLLLAESPLASAWFESFEIVEECPAREDAIRAVLVRHGLRTRSVRVRGRAVDADGLTRKLAARPDGDALVFAFRQGGRVTAVVARIA